ncbi:MAG: hypothetical protein BAJATHORv1_130005 [Candidatus Thorarchaeota archaeon]|nr:MAG: hypothetical protein BAJATHORv1_130005 [Candidatus Thorarchaeota archaeon]
MNSVSEVEPFSFSDKTELLSIEFEIIPVEKGRVNYFTGHLIRGAFLSMLAEIDESLVNRLHNGAGMRPYSVAPIRFPYRGDQRSKLWELKPGRKRYFRLSSLSPEVNTSLLKAVMKSSGRTIQIGASQCAVNSVRFKTASYTDLVKGVEPVRSHDFHFLSPTFFQIRSETFPMLFPIPTYVFGSLGSIWNRFAPSEVRIDMSSFMEELKSGICVTKHYLRTVQVRIKGRIPISGFLGKARFKLAREASDILRAQVGLLASFGPYSGMGAKRSFGFGAIDTISIED